MKNNFSIFTTRMLLILTLIFCTYTQNHGAKAAKNTAKFCTYTTIGLLAGCNGILLGGASSYFLYKLRKIKQSKISNAKFIIIKYLCKYCTDTHSLGEYIIPVTIVTLSTGSICSFYTSYHMLKHARKKLQKNPKKIK